ncbi:hypothetical protein GOBAR_AA08261 [Gossypium barbadense]|uniref:Protein JASON n=1 Tax=Gossypium barbadense TaxID=3634 RepID=A0A2P5Y9V2_GOSBA|nr:hypothetical protein GOBAR_AA08261 [Gossypium barbadense]
MVCDFLNRDSGLGIISRSVVRFLDLTVCRAMGCFFHCFGVRTDRSRPHLVASCSKSTERTVSRNRLSSLFVDEEKGDSPSNDLESPQINKGLKDEAKFLKSCGTIPETPVEIRKASHKLKQSPPCGGDSETSKYRSWLPNTSIDKLQLDKKSDQPPTPSKLFEVLGRSDSPDNTPSSCISNAANTGMSSICSTEGSEATTADKTAKTGTVFPSNVGIFANGKTRIRSEYVHLVLNPVGNASPLNAMKKEPLSSKEMFNEQEESPERLENGTPKLGVKQASLGKDSEDEGSLSAWLKPKQITIDDPDKNIHVTSSKTPQFNRTPGDRPIIGMVAAHWNEDESSRISPKWWDGNGIPNSTNKYKEDQKVSWHATPFEERLEKALSEESLISQRKPVDRTLMSLDEIDESDTALSQLRPSSHAKSVVSF